MNTAPRWLAAIAVLSTVVGFASFHAWRQLRSPAGPTVMATPVMPVPAIAATAEGSDGQPDEPAQAVIPDRVPDISLPDLNGQRHPLPSYRGHPTIFNFWASWCAPCRREIPLLNGIARDPATKNVKVVGIAADLKSNVVDFMKTTPIDYQVLIGEHDGSEAASRFGVPLVLPFSVFVSAGGQVVAVKLGELHREEAAVMLTTLGQLDAGTLALDAARKKIAARLRELAAERARQSAAAAG